MPLYTLCRLLLKAKNSHSFQRKNLLLKSVKAQVFISACSILSLTDNIDVKESRGGLLSTCFYSDKGL